MASLVFCGVPKEDVEFLLRSASFQGRPLHFLPRILFSLPSSFIFLLFLFTFPTISYLQISIACSWMYSVTVLFSFFTSHSVHIPFSSPFLSSSSETMVNPSFSCFFFFTLFRRPRFNDALPPPLPVGLSWRHCYLLSKHLTVVKDAAAPHPCLFSRRTPSLSTCTCGIHVQLPFAHVPENASCSVCLALNFDHKVKRTIGLWSGRGSLCCSVCVSLWVNNERGTTRQTWVLKGVNWASLSHTNSSNGRGNNETIAETCSWEFEGQSWRRNDKEWKEFTHL